MQKFTPGLRRISLAIIMILPVLGIFNFLNWWRSAARFLPLTVRLNIASALMSVVAVGFMFFFWPALVILGLTSFKGIAEHPWKTLIALLLIVFIGIPVWFGATTGILSAPETIDSSAQLDGRLYYVTRQSLLSANQRSFSLFQCDGQEMNCQQMFELLAGPAVKGTELTVNSDTHHVQFWTRLNDGNQKLIYTFSP